MIQELIRLGLTEYESKAYSTLLEQGNLKGGPLSKVCGVPQGKVYLVLSSLIEKGFVVETLSKPKVFKAKNPEIAINSFLNQKINDLQSLKQEIIPKMKNPTSSKNKALSENITLLGSKRAVLTTLDELATSTKKELKHMFTFEQYTQDYLERLKSLQKRGVKIRIIASLWNEEIKKEALKYIKSGIEVKYLPTEEIRFSIRDNEECIINFIDPNDARKRIGIYFAHGVFATHMGKYFDELWRRAKSIR